MIISVKWNDKNSTFKIGEYTFKSVQIEHMVPNCARLMYNNVDFILLIYEVTSTSYKCTL